MKLKNRFKSILLSFLLSTTTANYTLASTLSEDTRYEYFSGDRLSIKNVLEEQDVNLSIKGNTLVNLADIDSDYELRNNSSVYTDFTICETSKLKLNTDYTFVIEKELLDNHNNNFNHFEIGVADTLNTTNSHPALSIDDSSYASQATTFNKSKQKEIIRKKIKFTDFRGFKYLSVRPIRRYSDYVSGEYANANIKVVLLEGDYTGEDIRYFKDFQSVGENQSNLEIKYTGKNLYPYGDITSNWDNNGTNSLIGWIKVKPNTTYTASRKSNSTGLLHFIEYRTNDIVFLRHNECYTYRDGNEFSVHASDTNTITFTTGKDINYLFVTASSGATETTTSLHSEIMLEEGSTKTEYEPYKEHIVTIPINEPLRSTPEGKSDRIIKKGDKWYIERNCKEVLVNANDNDYYIGYWSSGEFDTDTLYAVYLANPVIFGTYVNPIYIYKFGLSNIFKNLVDLTNTNKGFTVGLTAQPPYLGFKLEKDIVDSFSGNNVADRAFNYLKSLGDMTFVLELLTPEYEPLNISGLDTVLNTGTTHITSNSNTPANIELTVDRVANRAQETVNLATSNPTVENLSKARFWTNLMKESTLKDNFQGQININRDVIDLTMDKNDASANADIYIIPKNTLSLSLNTNSIIFDDIDSTQDTELKSAVNLTVNSSLPYTVSASLESEMYNKDKSDSLDKSLLNIKSSDNSTYLGFTDIKVPVTLIEEQQFIKNKVHSIDLLLTGDIFKKADVYKSTLKFEVEQK